MRRIALPLLVIGMMIATSATALAFQSYAGSFDDDDGNVHEANIEALKDAEITFGCDDTAFCPDDSVTRGQMAAFIVRAFDLPSSSTDYFDDDSDSIFEDNINALRQAEITSGCNPPDNDEYCPDSDVTRGQMAVFITKALDRDTTDEYENHFTDDDDSIFEPRIDELRNAGVTKGCNPPDNDEFCPEDAVTRAQMASFLAKAKGLSADDPTPFPGQTTCDPAYSPCVPTVEESGDLNCPDIREEYPNGVQNDSSIGDPHNLNRDGDGKACEPAGS